MSFLIAHTKAPVTPCRSAQKNHDNPSSVRRTWPLPSHKMHKPNSSQKHAGTDNFSMAHVTLSLPLLACFPPHLRHLHSVTFRRLNSNLNSALCISPRCVSRLLSAAFWVRISHQRSSGSGCPSPPPQKQPPCPSSPGEGAVPHRPRPQQFPCRYPSSRYVPTPKTLLETPHEAPVLPLSRELRAGAPPAPPADVLPAHPPALRFPARSRSRTRLPYGPRWDTARSRPLAPGQRGNGALFLLLLLLQPRRRRRPRPAPLRSSPGAPRGPGHPLAEPPRCTRPRQRRPPPRPGPEPRCSERSRQGGSEDKQFRWARWDRAAAPGRAKAE